MMIELYVLDENDNRLDPQPELKIGDRVEVVHPNGVIEKKPYNPDEYLTQSTPVEHSILTITNVDVRAITYNKEKDSYIHEVIQNDIFLLTADIDTVQNFKFTVMIERVADHHQRIDDVRLDAVVNQGKVTIRGYFPNTGNYILSCDRLNRGLERLGRPFRLQFDDVEFNSKLAIPNI